MALLPLRSDRLSWALPKAAGRSLHVAVLSLPRRGAAGGALLEEGFEQPNDQPDIERPSSVEVIARAAMGTAENPAPGRRVDDLEILRQDDKAVPKGRRDMLVRRCPPVEAAGRAG